MPLFEHAVAPQIALWNITEDATALAEHLALSGQELAELEAMLPPRRAASLAARRLVQHLTGHVLPCKKNAEGKPYLPGTDWHISYSHSDAWAAAIAAKTLVGIDIQRVVPKVMRVMPRLFNADELSLLATDAWEAYHATVLWSAKECLFKAFGRRNVIDFRKHLLIEPFEFRPEGGSFGGSVIFEETALYFELRYLIWDEAYVLVWTIPD